MKSWLLRAVGLLVGALLGLMSSTAVAWASAEAWGTSPQQAQTYHAAEQVLDSDGESSPRLSRLPETGVGQPDTSPQVAVVGVAANTARLEARAAEVHGVLDPIAQNSRTAAALSTREGVDVLAGGGRDLSPLQRERASGGEILARSLGAHAEVIAVNGARGLG